MAEIKTPLKIKSFQQALELAKEYETGGFRNFSQKYGEKAVDVLQGFFENHFNMQSSEKAKVFIQKLNELNYPFTIDFFYSLDAVGELPNEWKPLLNQILRKNGMVKPLMALRGARKSVRVSKEMPRSLLPNNTNELPFSRQIEIVNRAYDWALQNTSPEKAKASFEFIFSGEKKTPQREFARKWCNSFLKDQKTRFMWTKGMGLRLKQRQNQIKKGKRSLRK